MNEFLSDVTEAQAETQAQMVAIKDDQLMQDLIKRVEEDGIPVTEISDDDSDDEDAIDPEVSQFGGDLNDSFLAQINSALDTLLNLATARPEEDFAPHLASLMRVTKKWSSHIHFQLPRQQPSIKNYFSKPPVAAERSEDTRLNSSHWE